VTPLEEQKRLLSIDPGGEILEGVLEGVLERGRERGLRGLKFRREDGRKKISLEALLLRLSHYF
jgi:hypothetical protein